MESWLQMPQGMVLKSDGFASNLSDPSDSYPLARFCAERSIEYEDDAASVSLQTFCDYGLAFRERFVTALEEKMVVSLDHDGEMFALELDDGAIARARRVVVAVGIGCFRYFPAPLSGLPNCCVSHSFDRRDLSSFAGRRVAIVGGGASAVDLAGLLHERGCDVRVICRRQP
jgi:cation diffusion facilitator CzcD-associated flavoprotein CzcO